MAITRAKKEEIIARLKQLFQESKLTLVASYEGVSVAQFRGLRTRAGQDEVVIRVVKNRLVRQALADLKIKHESFELQGMLVYIFSLKEETQGPRTLRSFVQKSNAPLQFVGGITAEGAWMSGEEVSRLAMMGSKQELLAEIIARLQSPVSELRNRLSGSLPAMMANLEASKN